MVEWRYIPSSILTNPKLGTVMCLHLQQAIHIGECQFSLGEKKIEMENWISMFFNFVCTS